MPYRTDYHLHTIHSMDCEMPLDTLCEQSIAVGTNEICITDHTEFGHPGPGCDIPPDPIAWIADIERARAKYPQLTIRAGLEIGDNPLCRQRIKEWHMALPLDFRLLSMHLIDNADPYFPDYFNDSPDQTAFYRRYVECRLESIHAWGAEAFESIAHLGYCAKFAPYPPDQRALRLHHAPDELDALLRYLAENGKAMEINTSGRRSMGEFIPDREIVARFAELGGEFVTIGSDAHIPEHVGNHLDDAAALAKSCGIRWQATFDQRRLIPIAL